MYTFKLKVAYFPESKPSCQSSTSEIDYIGVHSCEQENSLINVRCSAVINGNNPTFIWRQIKNKAQIDIARYEHHTYVDPNTGAVTSSLMIPGYSILPNDSLSCEVTATAQKHLPVKYNNISVFNAKSLCHTETFVAKGNSSCLDSK